MNKQDVERFRECLTEQGYGEQADIILKVLEPKKRNSIVIKTEKAEEADFKIGESKIGGDPHLPPDFEWPEFQDKPLLFLAQINLEDTVSFDTENLLPQKGILYFFHEGGLKVWGFDPKDKGGFCVKYYDGDTDKLSSVSLPVEPNDGIRLLPCKLQFSQIDSYPDLEDFNGFDFRLDNGKDSDFLEVLDDAYDTAHEESNDIINKLLGCPNLVQGDIFLEAQLVTNGLYCGDTTGYEDPKRNELESGSAEWILLFQLDSDDNADVMWGDCGRIYFTIKKTDLLSRNFDGVWSSYQGC